MEACGGAHHIGRFCLQNGHEPRLMSGPTTDRRLVSLTGSMAPECR
jgi:hypothetical protein